MGKNSPLIAPTTSLQLQGICNSIFNQSIILENAYLLRAQLSIEFHRFHLNGTALGQNADCLITDYFVVEQKIRNLGWRQVRRYCGDWKDQLKAIHVVTKVSVLRIQAFLAAMHGNEKDKSRGFVAKVCTRNIFIFHLLYYYHNVPF